MSLLQRLGLGRTPASDPDPACASPPAEPPAGPLQRIGAAQAREAHQHNPQTVWAARAFQVNQADRGLACHRIWQPLPEIGIRPKFQIDAAEPVFAMGSCFAREVEDALVAQGFAVPTHCEDLFDDPLFDRQGQVAAEVRQRAYLNRYNSMSMLDEVRHLLGLAPELEDGLLSYTLNRGATADLHYSQSVPQTDRERSLLRRQRVRERLGPQLRRARVVVLTLGLAECWFDRAAGRYLNNTPGPRVMAAFGEQLEVHQTTFGQHLAALQSLHGVLTQALGEGLKIVVTVSPVPLERTFLDQDVIVSNRYAKSMLRAVAAEFAAAHANVDYFPSYEIVSYADPSQAWAWDQRHVSPTLVDHIMRLFSRHYVPQTTPAP